MAAGGAALRAFVAIDLPAPIKEALGRLQAELALSPEIIRWVRPENLHLTLQFLGEVPEARVVAVGAALEGVAHRADPFVVSLARLGAFPSLGTPRVVWVGVERGVERVEVLARAVGRALRPLGFKPEDRPFRPHLTLGRVRLTRAREPLVRAVEQARDVAVGEVLVDRVVLFRSDLRPSGPIYAKLRECPLGTEAGAAAPHGG